MTMPPFDTKLFDVEHALNIYADTFATIPAALIYDQAALAPMKEQIALCHLYLIGLVPKVEFAGVRAAGDVLTTSFDVGGNRHDLDWPLPAGSALVDPNTERWHIELPDGRAMRPQEARMAQRLSAQGLLDFEVLYIGQAFGADGSRNVLDRLLKHETLQKIAVGGVPSDRHLTILMLGIQVANRIMTLFNPFAQNKEEGRARIAAGVDKLFNTNEAERTTLYEASLIRYFQPRFNKIFKESFPSTNQKVLADCYDKDFSAIIAEIAIEELPFQLRSDVVPMKPHHIAHHDLHDAAARQVFFVKT